MIAQWKPHGCTHLIQSSTRVDVCVLSSTIIATRIVHAFTVATALFSNALVPAKVRAAEKDYCERVCYLSIQRNH